MPAQGRLLNIRALAGVAQLVEQRIRNARVVGSIPISGTAPPAIRRQQFDQRHFPRLLMHRVVFKANAFQLLR